MKLVVTISLQEKIHRLKHYGQLSDIDVITISSTPVHEHVGLRVYILTFHPKRNRYARNMNRTNDLSLVRHNAILISCVIFVKQNI